MKHGKRLFTLFLTVVLVALCFTVPVSAVQSIFGSSVGNMTVSPGNYTGTGIGFPGETNALVRMRAVPLRFEGGGIASDQKYMTVDKAAKVVDQKPLGTIIQNDDYEDGWIYFYTGRTVSSIGDHYNLDMVFGPSPSDIITEPMWFRKSERHSRLLQLCGYSADDSIGHFCTNPDNITRLFGNKEGVDNKGIGEYFGLSGFDAEHYYIVVERFTYYHISYPTSDGKATFVPSSGPHAGQTVWELFYAETYASNKTLDESYAWILNPGGSGGLRWNSWAKVDQGAEAPFEGYTMGERVPGYSLYSFCELEDTQMAGGNVAVEYFGDVNTSDPAKFKSTGSIIGLGESSTYAYWDFNQSMFIDNDSEAALLKFAGKIDMTEEFALCFTGATDHNVSDDIKLEQRLQRAFEDAPGEGYTTSSLTWGTVPATGGMQNVGYVWKVTALDGYTSVVPIINKFQNAFNLATSGVGQGQLSVGAKAEDTTSVYKSYDVLEGSWLNAMKGASKSSTDVLQVTDDGKYTLIKDEQFGMGYEFIIKGTPVLSREITILVEGADGGVVESVSDSQTWEERYTTAKNIVHIVDEIPDYKFVGWLVVPYQDDSVTDSIKSSLAASSTELSSLFAAAKSGAPTRVADSGRPSSVGLGSTLHDQPPEGYTVYRIGYRGPSTPLPPGEVVLPAYMLNRYFDKIIQTSSQIAGHPQKFTLASDWTWVEWNSWVHCHCKTHYEAPNGYKDDWVHEYRDTASSEEFGLDNAMIDRYYPRARGTWSGAQRSLLYGHGWTQPMDTRGMSETAYVVDYAFNLVRANSSFGDIRSMSGISYTSYLDATKSDDGPSDSANMLRISGAFGVVPTTVKNASPARNSVAVLKTYTEKFNIESRFQHDASPTGNHTQPMASGSCSHRHGSWRSYWYCHSNWSYYPGIKPHLIDGFRDINGSYSDKITYQFNASAFKYTTKDDLGVGKNDFLGGSSSKPLTTARRSSTAGSITPSNFYRFTTVRYTGPESKFHPENYMVFKIGGTEFASIDRQRYAMSYVISEIKRTAKDSGMYFFRLNGDVTSIPGTVYSDSMQGGTGMLGFGSTVSIPAGSDVTIAADPTGVSIDLYAYTLDLVQTGDNGKIGAVGAGRAYNTVVRSGADAYTKWGNSDSHEKLLQHFNTWCDNILDVKNFAADFQLFVGTTVGQELKSENFSATVGRVERGSEGTKEDGIYQLVVEKGILQTTKGDYNAMISQIVLDYGCTRTEAIAMFEESGIYTAIINAMETCKNPKNNSKDVFYGLNYTPDIEASWTNDLGGDGNWYDETSRTFVIRRFTNLGNKLCDVIAEDKIDYQLAPTATSPYGENANSSVSYNAWWKMHIFFDQNAAANVNDLLLGSSTYYQPQTGSGGFNSANNAWSVMFNSIPVANADFVIPASSTQDFYN